jgi:hypothetical protein
MAVLIMVAFVVPATFDLIRNFCKIYLSGLVGGGNPYTLIIYSAAAVKILE